MVSLVRVFGERQSFVGAVRNAGRALPEWPALPPRETRGVLLGLSPSPSKRAPPLPCPLFSEGPVRLRGCVVLPLPRHHHVDSVFSLESAASVDSGALDPGSDAKRVGVTVTAMGSPGVLQHHLSLQVLRVAIGGEGAVILRYLPPTDTAAAGPVRETLRDGPVAYTCLTGSALL
ncbi:hypothetical protein HPB47_020825 [Ixodes persulcatus]|uniref:Uncharacterized protein n=1 Tax=Ixodes persulcatus TaxID=34615 RepID=A0AC60QED3_IXOPE|nr:hypothetical protein HPB47_020825 [Ixodes persulcatus]